MTFDYVSPAWDNRGLGRVTVNHQPSFFLLFNFCLIFFILFLISQKKYQIQTWGLSDDGQLFNKLSPMSGQLVNIFILYFLYKWINKKKLSIIKHKKSADDIQITFFFFCVCVCVWCLATMNNNTLHHTRTQ